MKLIVGLGNPGEKYQNNRHNVGFMFVDFLLKNLTTRYNLLPIAFKDDKYLQSQTAEVEVENKKIILVKPQTYMNKSGIAIRSCVNRYSINIAQDLIVVHDDLDIPLEKFKIQKGTGPLLHNGLESIEKNIGTKNFLRIRIGVDNRPLENRIDGETYVLQDFKEEEKEMINKSFSNIFISQYVFKR